MSYDSFMTSDRIDTLIHAPRTLEGLYIILDTLVTTAYIKDKPSTFYNSDLYMLIGMAFGICDQLLKEQS